MQEDTVHKVQQLQQGNPEDHKEDGESDSNAKAVTPKEASDEEEAEETKSD